MHRWLREESRPSLPDPVGHHYFRPERSMGSAHSGTCSVNAVGSRHMRRCFAALTRASVATASPASAPGAIRRRRRGRRTARNHGRQPSTEARRPPLTRPGVTGPVWSVQTAHHGRQRASTEPPTPYAGFWRRSASPPSRHRVDRMIRRGPPRGRRRPRIGLAHRGHRCEGH
jgi:hypothetical protein